MHPVSTIRANALAMMTSVGAPVTREHLTALASKYERAYRRYRAAKRPPAREHLCGALSTARAFYSLARRADVGR